MNSIVKKVMFVLAIVFGLYTAVLYLFMVFAVLPSFTELQDAAVGEEVKRCRLILRKEMAAISAVCADWTAWDDACQFIADRNEAFIKSALDPAVLQNTRLNTAIFMDTSGKTVWGKTYDWQTGKEIDVPEFSAEQMQRNPFFYAHKTVDSERTGLMRLGDRMAIVSTRPVVSSRKELPIRGSVFMARFISDEDIRALAESLGTHFLVKPAAQVRFAPEPGHDYTVQRSGSDRATASILVDDVFGNPTIAIVADIPTPILNRGILVGHLISSSVIVAGVVTLVVTFILLKKMILRRLDELSAALGRVAGKGRKAQAGHGKNDEVGIHMQMVMEMLKRLDSTEHALDASDQRFRTSFFHAPFPIMIYDETGKVIQLNREWTETTGYTHEDIPMTDTWCRKACGADATKAVEKMQSLCLAKGHHEACDTTIHTKDGRSLTWTICSWTIGKSPDGHRQVIAMAVDMTERQKAQRRLLENESLFRSLTESIPGVTYLASVTHDAKLIYVSPQVMTQFGFTPVDMKAMPDPWKMIIRADYYDKIMDERYAGLSNTMQQFTGEYPAIGRSGETTWLREEARLVNTEKGPMIQGVLFDITGTMRLSETPSTAAMHN